MGAVICTSEKAATSCTENTTSRNSGKSLRRRLTKDSVYDSKDFVECSSLINSNEKGKIKPKNNAELPSSVPNAVEKEELITGSCPTQTKSAPSRERNAISGKYLPSAGFFKNAWSRKHKTYTSNSTQCIRKMSCDSHCCPKIEPLCKEVEKPPVTSRETDTQTDIVTPVDSKCSSTATCLEHLTTFLSFDGKCGLCDFVHSGEHYRWNSLEDDASAVKEVSKSIGKWLHSMPKFMDKIVLQKSEPFQKVRIILRKDKHGVQEILVTDGCLSYQIQDSMQRS